MQLNLGRNLIKSLPSGLVKLEKLRTLVLSHNLALSNGENYKGFLLIFIDGLPQESWSTLSSLTHLDISFTNIQSLPPGLFNLNSLNKLYFFSLNRNTILSSIPEFFNPSSLMEVNLSGLSIQKFPPALFQLTGLKVLYFFLFFLININRNCG